ncbi:MAG: hypothetical protein SCARUB_04949 [Candidatus Scalindua rubra]|uniref:Uncharacterized protein n=1 Tax=Candidatus Scalindua rubra TaxID=1872076 RepID=A0A1E3X2U5_9BACT|nr:MAG: hypothetical protein SCARUB_04949 [Candidatus Scalindua rubra]
MWSKALPVIIIWFIGFVLMGIAIGGRTGPFNPLFFLIAIPVLLLAYYLQQRIGKSNSSKEED